jgi:hypothetical protein
MVEAHIDSLLEIGMGDADVLRFVLPAVRTDLQVDSCRRQADRDWGQNVRRPRNSQVLPLTVTLVI